MRWWWPFSRGGGRRRASASASTSNNGYDLTPPGSADSLAAFGIADSSVAAVEAKLAFLKKCKLIVDVLADGTVGDLEAELRHMATHMRAVEMPEGRVFADTRKFMDLQSLYLVVGGVVEVFAPDENNGDAVTLIGVVVQGQVVGLLRELYQLPAGAYAKVKHGEAIPPSLVRPITEVNAWLKSVAAAEVQKNAATSRWGGWMAKVFRRRRGRDDVDSSTGATGATGAPLAIAPTEEAVSNLRGELNDAPTRGNAVLYEIPPNLLERSRLSEKLRARQVTLEDLLSFVPLLKSLTEAQRRLLCDCFERVVVPPDKAISSKAADSDDDGDDDLSDDDDGDIMDAIDELASSRGGSTTRRSGSRKTNATNLFDEEVRPRREQRAALAAVAADRRHYRCWRGLVVRQGEDGDAFYVVVSGRLVALLETDAGAVDAAAIGDVLDDEGRVVPRSFGFEVAQYSRGGYFGELALLTGEPRKATVKNASGDEPAVLMRCTAADFERKILCMPGVRNALEATMASVAAFNRMRAEERNREDEMMKRKHIEDVINMTGSPMIGQSPSPSPSPTKRFGEGLSPAITERTGMATPSSAASPHSMGTLLTPALSGRPSYMRRVAPDTEELRGLDELRPPKGEQRIKKLVSILQCTLALEGLKVHEGAPVTFLPCFHFPFLSATHSFSRPPQLP
ncbi:cAMP-dependent protein kinase regulator [Pycnococcus provasolii]